MMDSTGKEYYQGIDFDLDQNGSIAWKSGKEPATGTIYSIHYEAHVQFRATKAMHSNRFTQVAVEGGVKYVKMPEQWLLQKEFLVKRKDKDGNEILPNRIIDPQED
jgi:hypothetical protein